MARFVASRLLTAAAVLVAVSILVVMLVHLMPGSPAETILGEGATPERVAAIEAELGLDRPVIEQYGSWVAGMLGGDLGASLFGGIPVVDAVTSRLGVTLSLVAGSLFLGLVVGVALGTVAAVRAGSWPDKVVAAGSALAAALPPFWVALMFAVIFALGLGLFPATGYVPMGTSPVEWLRSLVLPVTALSLGPAAVISRQTRSAMVEVLQRDYIRAALGRGIRLRVVIVRYGLKNAFIPVITSLGLIAAALIGGAVFVEKVFALPGIGDLLVTSVQTRDVPVIQGVVMIAALAVLVINLLVDLSYGWLNPKARVR